MRRRAPGVRRLRRAGRCPTTRCWRPSSHGLGSEKLFGRDREEPERLTTTGAHWPPVNSFPYAANMLNRLVRWLGVPLWVAEAGLASSALGVVLMRYGLRRDASDHWANHLFQLNLTSSVACSLIGIPVAVVVLSKVVDQVAAHRAGVRLRKAAILSLITIADASARAIADGITGTASPLLPMRLAQCETLREHSRDPDLDPPPDESAHVTGAEDVLDRRGGASADSPEASDAAEAAQLLFAAARKWSEYYDEERTCQSQLDLLQVSAFASAGQGVAFIPPGKFERLRDDIEAMSRSSDPGGSRRHPDSAVCAADVHLSAIRIIEGARTSNWPVRKVDEVSGVTRYQMTRALPAPLGLLITAGVMLAASIALAWYGTFHTSHDLWDRQPFFTNLLTAFTGALAGIPLSVLVVSAVLENTRDHRVKDRILIDTDGVLAVLADLAAQCLGREVASANSPDLSKRLEVVRDVKKAMDRARSRTYVDDKRHRAWVEGQDDGEGEPVAPQRRSEALQVAAAEARAKLGPLGRTLAEYKPLRDELDGATARLTQLNTLAQFEAITELTTIGLGAGSFLTFEMDRAFERTKEWVFAVPIAAADLYDKVHKWRVAAARAGWPAVTLIPDATGALSAVAGRAPTVESLRPVQVRAWSRTSLWPSGWPGTEDTRWAEIYVRTLPRVGSEVASQVSRYPPPSDRWRPRREHQRGARTVHPFAAIRVQLARTLRRVESWTGARVASARRTRPGRLLLHPVTIAVYLSMLLLMLFTPSR